MLGAPQVRRETCKVQTTAGGWGGVELLLRLLGKLGDLLMGSLFIQVFIVDFRGGEGLLTETEGEMGRFVRAADVRDLGKLKISQLGLFLTLG